MYAWMFLATLIDILTEQRGVCFVIDMPSITMKFAEELEDGRKSFR
jgi:hypothetical protein